MGSRISNLFKFRKFVLLLFDLGCFVLISAAYYIICLFTENPVVNDTVKFVACSCILAVITSLVRLLFGTYSNVWRYTSTSAYLNIVIADFFSCLLTVPVVYLTDLYTDVSHIFLISALFALMTLSSRFVYRLIYKRKNANENRNDHKINVAIVGAGQLGAILAEELLCNSKSHYKPICFIDNDKAKQGSMISGLRVIYEEGDKTIEEIKNLPIQEIFFALPNIDNETAEKLYDLYSKTGCKIKIYDTPVKDMFSPDSAGRKTIRDFQIEDLLFRKSVDINNQKSFDYYSGKTVLITGGGGSIGSELCRQIAKCGPKKLIILDIYENNAYDIQQELINKYGRNLDLSVEIASVRERERLDCIFDRYRPDVVFHAAAHKHVPLMEHSGCEAIKNNVFGTYNTADMAEKYGVEKFILISTDKAVNPTNIMGASKRLCEMIIQCRTDGPTKFAAVRFGNVLGSNGSVIPLFKKQIEKGGPITITDKRIIRYFMTIPEASQLVMQAGAMAQKGELFVLDMGKPVKIIDLATNMIKLSGLTPGVDIKIEEIGLRPGEKLYEELLIKTETLTKTDNNMIFIETDKPLSRSEVDDKMEILRNAVKDSAHELSSAKIKTALHATVSTYHEPEQVNKDAYKAEEMKNTVLCNAVKDH